MTDAKRMTLKELATVDAELTQHGFSSGEQSDSGLRWIWRRGSLLLCLESGLWFTRLSGLGLQPLAGSEEFETWGAALLELNTRVKKMMSVVEFPGITDK